ncbi:MAG: response regulator [Bacteroidetes bacterium]|nr:response regulator [Bacteroidota bacterium]
MDILIIDDADSVRHNIIRMIQQKTPDFVIHQASTCTEAIQKIERKVHDVVIVDIKLPDGSGFDIMERIKVLSPSPLVIFLSNFSNSKFKEKALSLGASYFFDKTEEFDQLMRLVQNDFRSL